MVPRAYRPEIVNLAHATPMSGHLGVYKTYHKIHNHFFWPGLKSDVSHHCQSCHTCQMVGNPIRPFQKPIPAFDEPLSRIIIDCVGPLPKTKSGCKYFFTVMCASTGFPSQFYSEIPRLKHKLKHLRNFSLLRAFNVCTISSIFKF